MSVSNSVLVLSLQSQLAELELRNSGQRTAEWYIVNENLQRAKYLLKKAKEADAIWDGDDDPAQHDACA